MESVGYEGPVIHASAHALNYYWKVGSQQTGTITIPDAETEFHVYAVEWFVDHMDFYVDDEKYLTVRPKGGDLNDSNAWPFDNDQFIIMNIRVDGQWAHTPTAESADCIINPLGIKDGFSIICERVVSILKK